MVIVLKNRAAIYQREAAEMLHNISLYPGLTEEQLCRFFPEKEATAKTLLAHIYDHNLPIKVVRDYDNLELKAVIDVIATFCLTDDTGALCDSFQTTRFGYSSSTVITVMPKNCFSAWLNTPKSAENRPPLFPKNS